MVKTFVAGNSVSPGVGAQIPGCPLLAGSGEDSCRIELPGGLCICLQLPRAHPERGPDAIGVTDFRNLTVLIWLGIVCSHGDLGRFVIEIA